MANKLFSSLVATVLFIGLLAAPLYFADFVEQGELADFELGLSTQGFSGLENQTDVIGFPRAYTQPALTSNADAVWQCENGVGDLYKPQNTTVTNLGNISSFGSQYGSFILDLDGLSPTKNRFDVIAPAGVDSCRLAFYYNVSKADLLKTDVLSYVLNIGSNNVSFDYVEVVVHQYNLVTGVDTVPSVEILVASESSPYRTGDIGSIPVTTQDKLLINGAFADVIPAADRLYLTLVYYTDYTDMPSDGAIITHDYQLESERTGILSQEVKLIIFNIGYALIGGLLVVIATPWVSMEDIFGRSSMRKNRNGASDGLGMGGMIFIGVIVIGAAFWFTGGSGGFSGFFTASLLPLSIAVLSIAVVALSTRGKSNRGMTLILASVAGVFGWLLGQSIQSSWLAYDKLYVAPFVDILSGNVAFTDAFAISAFFVVIIQIAGTLVALFNITQTIGTDQVGTTQ